MWCAKVVKLCAGACFAHSAIRACFVDTVPRLGVLAMFPSLGSSPRPPLPSAGFPRREFPGFVGTTRHGEGSHHVTSFEARSRGFGTGCLRFAPPVTRSGRQTRFRWLARPCREGLVTLRVPTKGFRYVSYIPFPFPRLAWRKSPNVPS